MEKVELLGFLERNSLQKLPSHLQGANDGIAFWDKTPQWFLQYASSSISKESPKPIAQSYCRVSQTFWNYVSPKKRIFSRPIWAYVLNICTSGFSWLLDCPRCFFHHWTFSCFGCLISRSCNWTRFVKMLCLKTTAIAFSCLFLLIHVFSPLFIV